MTDVRRSRGAIAAVLGVALAAPLGCSNSSDHKDETAGTGGSSAGTGGASGGSGGASAGSGGASAGSGGTAAGGGGAGGTSGGTAGQAGAPVLTLCPGSNEYLSTTGALPEGATVLAGPYSRSRFFLFMSASDDYLFWGDNDSIHRTTLADGSDMVFYEPSFPKSIQGFTVVGPTLYFSEGGPSSLGVAKAPVDGSAAPTSLYPEPVYSWCVVADGFIYYGTQHATLARVPLEGGTSTDVVSVGDLGATRDPIVVGGALWFRYGNDDMSHIVKFSLDDVVEGEAGAAGTAPEATPVATTTYHGAPLVTDGTNIYYGDDPGLMKLPIAGGDASVFLAPATGGIGYVLGVSDGIIWSESRCGAVHHTATDGTELAPLLTMATAGPFTANSTHIFAAVGTQIIRFPRP